MAAPPHTAAFPSGPLLDSSGNLSPAWRGFFMTLYLRTGDAQGSSAAALTQALADETAAREAADADLHSQLAGETAVRQGADAVVQVGSPPVVSWTAGTTVPAAVAPVGSLYSYTTGAVGSTLYVSRGGGTWLAVAGV